MKNFVGFALSVLALAWASLIARGEASFPLEENLDPGWRFIQSDPAHAQDESFDDSAWRVVNLPHDYSVEGEYRKSNPAGGAGAYLPGGVAWYRRTIEIPDDFGDKLISVWFDAAARNSDVYINGKHLGSRPYAYISFSYDLTPRLHPGKNILAVRLDTSAMPASRWYTGSGLYAHVHLLVTDKLHFDRSATFITTSRAATNSAEVRCDGEIVNATGKAADARTTFQLLDESGAPAASVESSHHLDPGKSEKLTQSLHVDRPKLWSANSSYLYTLVARISLGQKLIDEQRIPVGIRKVHWDANTGFWINERNVKIKGVAMHYDAGGLGNAIPDQVLEARLRLLKAMGANAIRTGHTPFPPHFYDLCDRLGFLVMDEAFDGWRKKAAHDYGAENFKQWWRRDLADLVVRDRNHPSVILWSIGNETGDSDRLGMSKLVHNLDPTRATTGGQVLYSVGVSGFNGPGEKPDVLEAFHRKNPGQPILLSEEPHGYQTRGFYRTLTWWRDSKDKDANPFPPYSTEEVFFLGGDPQFNSSYDNAVVRITNRQCWLRTRDTPWISGQFRWSAFDYLGEASSGGRHWPARFWHPGIIDAAGFSKDIYYFYQSQWTSAPMVHILPHWTQPLVKPGTLIPVVAYSNCSEVELFLNGKSLGRKKSRDLLDFVWDVPYEPGELKAVGYRENKPVATQAFHTAGDPSRIELRPDHGDLKPDQRDVAAVTISVFDEKGELVPTADDRIDFRVTGPAELLAYENGNPVDVTPNRVPYRSVFAGLARGYFRSTSADGPVEITAVGALGDHLFQTSTRVRLAIARCSLRGPLAQAEFEIRYTLDNSIPTPASALYSKPITLTDSTTVRVLVLRDGKPFMTSVARFEKGSPPAFDDPRYEHSATHH